MCAWVGRAERKERVHMVVSLGSALPETRPWPSHPRRGSPTHLGSQDLVCSVLWSGTQRHIPMVPHDLPTMATHTSSRCHCVIPVAQSKHVSNIKDWEKMNTLDALMRWDCGQVFFLTQFLSLPLLWSETANRSVNEPNKWATCLAASTKAKHKDPLWPCDPASVTPSSLPHKNTYRCLAKGASKTCAEHGKKQEDWLGGT